MEYWLPGSILLFIIITFLYSIISYYRSKKIKFKYNDGVKFGKTEGYRKGYNDALYKVECSIKELKEHKNKNS